MTLLLAWLMAVELEADLSSYDLEAIREGAAWAVTLRPSEIAGQDAATKARMEQYADFRQAEGNALMMEWTSAGRPYPAEGGEYFFLAAAGWMKDAFDANAYSSTAPSAVPAYQFTRDVIANGEARMREGFRGLRFTDEEAFDLRLYRLWMNIRLTQSKVAPNEFGLRDPAILAEGAEFAPMRLPRFDAVLGWPSYRNAFNYDRADFLRPAAVDKIWRYFAGYEPVAASPQGYVTNLPWTDQRIAAETGSNPADWSTLGQAGAGKPLVAIAGYHADIFMKRCFPALEGLSQVYGEWANFVFLGIYYHDTYATIPEYFGPSAGRNMRIPHPLSFEESARISTLIYLTNPTVTVPTLVDDPSLTMRDQLFGEGGSAQFALLDLDGRLSFTPLHGWNWYNVGRNYAETARYDSILWLNYIERELRTLLANGGIHGANTNWNPPTPGMAGLHYFYNSAEVTSVDAVAKTIGFKTGAGAEVLVLPLDPDARLHPAFRLETLAPGNKLNLQVRQIGGLSEAIVEVAATPIASSDTIWRTATFLTSDPASRLITVDLDALEPDTMIGYQASLGPSNGATLFGIGLSNHNRLATFLGEAVGTRVFTVDAATMIFHNGYPASISKLVTGDRLAFKYLPSEDGRPAPAIDFLRATGPSMVTEGYQRWAHGWQSAYPSTDFGIHGNPDLDSLSNFMEYAMGCSPVDPSPAPIVLAAVGNSPSATWSLRFPRLAKPPPGLRYVVETSSGLSPARWLPFDGAIQIVETAERRGGLTELVEARFHSQTGELALYIRIRVEPY